MSGAPWVLRRWQSEALPVVMEAVRAGRSPVVSAFMGSGKSVLVAEIVRQAVLRDARRSEPGRRAVVVAAPRAGLVRQLSETIARGVGEEAVGQWYEGAHQGDRACVVTTYQSLGTLVEAWRSSGRRAALLVCDEAHATEAAGVRESIRALEGLGGGRLYRLGVTATPYRSGRETLSLWDEIVYRYGWREGVADGVIVPWEVVCWGDTETEITDARQVDAICVEMLRRADTWPALASADSISDAEGFAAALASAGIPAGAIHSEQPRRVQEERIAALREGRLRVLVHVSMLAEGADFPWLRTLLLRRQVRARVRFVQEVGRVLRSAPGKAKGLILDPFDLMGSLGMSHPDALGAALESGGVEAAVSADGGEEGEGGTPEERAARVKEAIRRRSVGVWLTSVCAALEEHGLVSLPALRSQRATARQVEVIGRMIGFIRWLPHSGGRERIRGWVKRGRIGELNRREASDLIGLLKWLADRSEGARAYVARTRDYAGAQRFFRWPNGVVLPTETPCLEGEK